LGYGEPMLDKFFLERIEFCKLKGLSVTTDTTGYLLKDELIRGLIDTQLDNIRFSIFSTTREIYHKLHNLDTFDIVYSRINKFLEFKKKKKSKLPITGVYFVEQELNKHQTQDFISYWKDKVNFVNVWKAHNWIDTYDLRKKNYKRKKKCSRPANGPLQIRWDGKVSACCFDFNTQLIVGDCSKNSLAEIEKSDANTKLIKAHESGDLSEYSICDNCDQMYETPDTLIYTNDPNNKVGVSGTTKITFE
jgi:radical SAM protein with 4Fe4S-binding SPASM domain